MILSSSTALIPLLTLGRAEKREILHRRPSSPNTAANAHHRRVAAASSLPRGVVVNIVAGGMEWGGSAVGLTPTAWATASGKGGGGRGVDNSSIIGNAVTTARPPASLLP